VIKTYFYSQKLLGP